MRNISRKYGPRIAAFGTTLFVGVGSALAAVPAAFDTAITDMTADGVSMGGSLVGVSAAVGVALLAVAYVKKIRSAAK